MSADVTSMAVSANGSVAVGLANGNTELLQLPARDEPISDTEFGVAPTLVGDGSPVAAVAAMADGSVFTGTSTGVLRHWPADATHGPVALPLVLLKGGQPNLDLIGLELVQRQLDPGAHLLVGEALRLECLLVALLDRRRRVRAAGLVAVVLLLDLL